MNAKAWTLVPTLLAVGFTFGGCSNDANNSSNQPGGWKNFCDLPDSCQQIAQACMPKDDGAEGPVHECHLTGMEYAVEANCKKDLESCLSTCSAAPALSDGPVEDLVAECRNAAATKKTDASTGP